MKLKHLVKAGAALAVASACFGVQAHHLNDALQAKVVPEASTTLTASDDVVFNVTLTNTSSEPIQILKWSTPFAGQITQNMFEVTRDGQPVAYRGPIYKRVAPTAADYYLLKPGQTYTAKVELSSLYDMTVTGDYKVRFHAKSEHLFNGAEKGLTASSGHRGAVTSEEASLWIDGMHPRGTVLAEPISLKQAQQTLATTSYVNCTSTRQSLIATSISNALNYATNSSNYLNSGLKGTRYTKWFGTYDATRYNTVKTHFTNIKNAFNGAAITVDCSCTDAGTYAYVYPSQPYKIYVCGAFWNAPATGTDSKAGTMVHEMSHFTVVAGTDDWAYGQTAAANLAISSPSKAVDNADSHEYFAENTPALN